jgi:hypothetical protein
MKKISYIFIIALLIGSNGIFSKGTQLDEKAIEQKVLLIEKMIARHNYAVAGLTAIGYIQQLSYWLPAIIEGIDYISGESSSRGALQQESVVENKEKIGFFSGIAQGTKDLLFTSDGWKRMGSVGLYFTGQIGAFFLFQKISEMVYHPDTLRWYIYAKVPYPKTIAFIKELSKKLSEGIDNPEELQHYQFLMNESCKQLVGYGEDMCAYMTYKSTGLSQHQQMLAERTARYLFNYQNDVFKKIFIELRKEKPLYGYIMAILQSYSDELKYQRKLFSSIEGETQEELKMLSN